MHISVSIRVLQRKKLNHTEILYMCVCVERKREYVCVREREKRKLKELAHITVGAGKSEI